MRIVWWNTALSPTSQMARSKASDENYITTSNHVRKLFTNYSCDMVALCEVSTIDVDSISSKLNLSNISVLDLTNPIGRTRFDVAVLYNNKKLDIRHIHSLSKNRTGQTIKAAQLVEIRNLDDNKKIQVFLCHWASRLNGDSGSRRRAAADIVYLSAHEFMVDGGDVIVIGDFNDNPYDESILNNLNSSRCLDAVRAYPQEYFYNPFWRSVVSKNNYSHLAKDKSFRSGTMKYKQFLGTMWHSYDQMMFSGSFLGNGYWHLNEEITSVLEDSDFIKDFDNKKSPIDHLPIICEITRL